MGLTISWLRKNKQASKQTNKQNRPYTPHNSNTPHVQKLIEWVFAQWPVVKACTKPQRHGQSENMTQEGAIWARLRRILRTLAVSKVEESMLAKGKVMRTFREWRKVWYFWNMWVENARTWCWESVSQRALNVILWNVNFFCRQWVIGKCFEHLCFGWMCLRKITPEALGRWVGWDGKMRDTEAGEKATA